jgi:hypothetical protein
MIAIFESCDDYWHFESYIKFHARHVLDTKQQLFLNAVLDTAVSRTLILPESTILWRAQLGHDWDDSTFPVKRRKPHSYQRMVPQLLRSQEGRVNAKGIPCLYCATDMKTAITEVRPWLGSYVSVAQFNAKRGLRVVDCTMDGDLPKDPPFRPAGTPEPPPEEREKAVWYYINRAFSEPVTRADDVADYAPTQVLAENFRHNGWDGIIYGSRLGKGKNFALFDLNDADCINCRLYAITSVDLTYCEHVDMY